MLSLLTFRITFQLEDNIPADIPKSVNQEKPVSTDHIDIPTDEGADIEDYYKKMVEANSSNPLFLKNYAQFLYQVKYKRPFGYFYWQLVTDQLICLLPAAIQCYGTNL